MPKTIDSVALFYKSGSSDKEYHLQLVEEATGCLVNFQYGRRGSTLNPGCKTKAPVTEEAARKVFNKIVAEKTSEGYTVGASTGGDYTASAAAAKPTTPLADRVIPQLLNPIDEVEMEALLRDEGWGCQEKKDGTHKMARKTASTVIATNKKGIEVGYPTAYAGGLIQIGLYDGESIGETYHVFDILEYGAKDLRSLGYGDRYKYLEGLFNDAKGPVRLVPLAVGYVAKKALLDKLVAGKKEGIVFKKLAARFTAGKAHSDMAKYKFYSTASVIVVKHNDKDSIAMGLLDSTGKVVGVGNVTTIGHVKAPVNSVVEVRYLYGYKGGCLYQPAYIGPRDDVDYNECSFDGQKIKFKAEED